jgi:hypothetical protein
MERGSLMSELPENLFTPRVLSPDDELWKGVDEWLEQMREHLPEKTLALLRDGADRWKVRATVPVEEREADPLLERSEITFAVFGLMGLNRDFYNVSDLDPAVAGRADEMIKLLEQSPGARMSQVTLTVFKIACLIAGARFGPTSEAKAAIRQTLERSREFYSSAEIENLTEVIEREFAGELPH